jgi:2,4-dienoyl-CoA reductase-like NADH-dependent reductase (Old Yellow Enzyme family)/thioredoxin reductase
MPDYSLLFQPINLGNVSIKNRFAMAPMTNGFAHPDGVVSERSLAYYAARARGQVGLIIVEGAMVHPSGKGWLNHLAVHQDRYVWGLAELARAIHSDGAKAFLQIMHCGRRSTSAVLEGAPPVAPSPLPAPGSEEVPRELTIPEIEELVESFVQAARRAREAGFDGVEIHGAHGYLITSFLSPYANRRTDRYGGDFEGRMRFLLEIIAGIREKVGPDFTLTCRLSVDEYASGGLEPELSRVIARRLEKAGIAGIHASAGGGPASAHMPMTTGMGQATLSHLAESLKQAVSIPVMAVGRIITPEAALSVLETGKADMVALGRALLADPAFVDKLQAGQAGEIIRCIGCQACQLRSAAPGIGCLVNAETGHEHELTWAPTAQPKDVRLIGAGLPGLEAARALAIRGHRVTVYGNNLPFGGLLALRARTPGNGEMGWAVERYRQELARLGVKFYRGSPDTGIQAHAQVVKVTSGLPILPDIPGFEKKHLFTAKAVLAGKPSIQRLGPRVAVIGGGILGGEVALYLADQGRQVTLIEEKPEILKDTHPTIAHRLGERLRAYEVRVLTSTQVRAWKKNCLSIVREGRESSAGPFDSVVSALGWVPAAAGIPAGALLLGDAYEAYAARDLVYAGTKLGRGL